MFLTLIQIRRILLFWVCVSVVIIATGNVLTNNAQPVKFTNLNNYLSKPSSIRDTVTNEKDFIDFKYYANKINEKYYKNIKDHIERFSSFGSRVTGYPGYNLTLNYIQDFFNNHSLSEVRTLSYPLLVPYDHGTEIVVNGKNLTAYALAPNSAQTCKISSRGLTGTLVYGGSGKYSELDGKKIEDAIVVLEFNSGDNWINVASLGAKAVIYLHPNTTNRYEAKGKSLDIPLYFPRIYVSNTTTANKIKQLSIGLNQSVSLYSDMIWKSIEAQNIMGLLPGLDDDIIVISAHFDSSSIVPSIAPGADEACGIATLLELIHLMRDENITPQKTIMFLALSGHNQAAAGAREFVSQNYDNLNTNAGIKLFLSLDLSASNNIIGINPYGYLYKFQLKYTLGNKLVARLKTVGEDFLTDYAAAIRKATDYSFEVVPYFDLMYFENIAPIEFVGDHEPFIASNVLGLSFFTTKSHRMQFNTPFDLPTYLQYDMLKPQVIYSICSLLQLINEENLGKILDLDHKDFSLSLSMHVGFANLEGYCKEYNRSAAWLSNIANAVIRVTSRDPETDIRGIYPYYTKTDENGYYQVRGISSSQPDNPLEYSVEAYSFDLDGRLIKANDLGEYGEFFKQSHRLVEKNIIVNPTIFNCGTIGLFGVSHPYEEYTNADSLNFFVLDPKTQNIFTSYGYLGVGSVCLVFITPNSPSFIVGELPDEILGIYVTNSSVNTLLGNGILVKKGGFLNLGISAFITTQDLQSLTQTYINRYSSREIFDDKVDEIFQKASALLNTAIQQKKDYKYSKAIEDIYNAQIWMMHSLKQARNVIAGSISSALLIVIFLFPFSFILSLLLFNFDSWKKWVPTVSSIYVLVLGFFYIIHPAFQIVPHLILTLIGIFNVISIFPVILLLCQEGYGFLIRQRQRMLGFHFTEINRTSVIQIAVKTGISRMKKHKIRTILSLSSVCLLTFSLTLMTSASILVQNVPIELGLPIIIAILLLINTSISAVYSSKKEISIFTSLGLTPSQIIGLFLTEFLVSALIGSIIGYLGGITFIRIVSSSGIIPEDFPINYSSGVVVTVLILTVAGMFLSIIYPLRISGQMSVPSLRRTWELKTLPEEDGIKWKIYLPFVAATEKEAEGIIVFLSEYFLIYESEAVGGPFFISSLIIKQIHEIKKELMVIVNLAPFDMGVKQKVIFISYFDKIKSHWAFEITLIRLEGELNAWIALVRQFIGTIRKQLLIWRTLPKEAKIAKIRQFHQKIP
ncbi:MAG: M28 family peptidase [Promethearchaeota archaeon]